MEKHKPSIKQVSISSSLKEFLDYLSTDFKLLNC